MLQQLKERYPERAVIRRSEVGRKVPLPQKHLDAVNEAGQALSKNYQRIREINEKYGIRSSK